MTLLRTSPGPNPLRGFQVDPAAIGRIGKDLQRPECILAERDGTLWSADAHGGRCEPASTGAVSTLRPTSATGTARKAAAGLFAGLIKKSIALQCWGRRMT